MQTLQPLMKKSFIVLCLPMISQAQTVVKRQPISLANPGIPTYPAVPLGMNIKDNGNIVLYTSYLVSGDIRDTEKKEKKVSKFLNSFSSVGGGTPDPGIPQVNELEYDAELKFVADKSKLVNYDPLEKDKSYVFNNQPISNDVSELPSLFSSFPYSRINTPAVEYAELAYKGKGLLGEKDKKYYPNFGGEVLKFYNNGAGNIEKQLLEGSHVEENKTALDGLVPKNGSSSIIYLKGNQFSAQACFYTEKDPDKYGEFKNYQFVTWDKEGNIISRETVNLPFAYDPEGVEVYNENKEAAGFFYLCKRSDASKKILSPDVNAYYVLQFDAKGKLLASFETKLGTDENKVSIAAVLSFKGQMYLLAQDRQRKAENISVYKVSTAGLDKISSFDIATISFPKELILNYWNNVQWGIAKNGNIYCLTQGVERVKAFGIRTNTPLGIYLMTLTPDFTTAAGQKVDFNDPLFTLKEFTIDLLDEQDGNFYLALTDTKSKNVAAAILGPQKSSGLATIYTPGYAVYNMRKNYTYDAKSKCLFVITEETKNLSKGEIVKVKF